MTASCCEKSVPGLEVHSHSAGHSAVCGNLRQFRLQEKSECLVWPGLALQEVRQVQMVVGQWGG